MLQVQSLTVGQVRLLVTVEFSHSAHNSHLFQQPLDNNRNEDVRKPTYQELETVQKSCGKRMTSHSLKLVKVLCKLRP
jgi:hypothetical protein